MNRDSSLGEEKDQSKPRNTVCLHSCLYECESVLVDELCADSKRFGHVSQRERAVGFQELAVGQDAHLSDIVTVMRSKQPVLLHLLFNTSYRGETNGTSNQHILKQ